MKEIFIDQENLGENEEDKVKKEKEEKELLEIEKLTSQDNGDLHICGAQEFGLRQSDWKIYLERVRLKKAWEPPSGSQYAKFEKTKTINSVEFVSARLKPRNSEGEEKSYRELFNLINEGGLGSDTAIILDSGGAHSVAMAFRLAEDCGYQPIIMFDSGPLSNGSTASGQDLAALLYYASGVDKLKQEGKIKFDAPPVFVLDAHRGSKPASGDKKYIDCSYVFDETDFPNYEELKIAGIKRVIYLNEDDSHGYINEKSSRVAAADIVPIFNKWKMQGIKIDFTGVEPWDHNDDFGSLPEGDDDRSNDQLWELDY
jgi:hypothetical protein